ncbi:MAG TPA: hypothetical protein VGY97_04235 [Solirubrobacteraceae bacterium]|jgi:hypothetical protein|nr:hypothetical protein [Solirubrobacteraceae bacterium]
MAPGRGNRGGHRAQEALSLAEGAEAAPAGRRRVAEGGFVVGACAAAALPVIVSTIRGLAAGFTPNGDRAIIATRAYDVFTSHTPLDGQYSASSVLLHQAVHSPGPMLYWLLAVPARIGPAALALTMGAVNVAAASGVVLVARSRGGRGLMLVVAVAVSLMCRSLVGETYHDIWNPSAGLMPLTALVFVAWAVACGSWRLLPVALLLASFVAQCQFAFVPPGLAVVAVALGGVAVAALRGAPARADEGGRRERIWPWTLAALAVAAVCWSFPVFDQIAHGHGNLGLALRVARVHRPTLGLDAGWHAVVRAIGIPPWWLRVPSTPFDRLADVRSEPSDLATVSSIVLVLLLAVATVLGAITRRRDVASGGLIGLALCGALASVAAFTPTRPSLVTSLGYTMWWGSVAGMWVWLALGWAVVKLQRPGRLMAARGVPARVSAIASALGLAVALLTGAAVAGGERRDQDQPEYRPIRTVIGLLGPALSTRDRRIRVAGAHSFVAFDFKAAIIYALRLRGRRPLASNATARLGAFYESRNRSYDRTVYVWDGHPPPGGTVVSRVSVRGPPPEAITVTLSARPR